MKNLGRKLSSTLLSSLFCLLLVCNAQASLITHNDYTLDSDTSIVTGGGLEWLRWDKTIGRTIAGALDEIDDGILDGIDYGQGWRVATNVDMAGLYNNFFGDLMNWDTDEDTLQEVVGPYTASEDPADDIANAFIELYGVTQVFRPFYGPDTQEVSSFALFGLDLNGDNFINLARVSGDYIRTSSTGRLLGPSGGLTFLSGNFRLKTSPSASQGVALVRDITLIPDPDPNPSPNEVPTPSSIAFVGLMVLFLVRIFNMEASSF